MSVWNTWNPDLIQAIIEEKSPEKKMKIASHTINSQQILSHKLAKNKCPELPPVDVEEKVVEKDNFDQRP